MSVDTLTSDQQRLFDRMRGALTGTEAAHFSDSRHLVMFLKYFGRVYGTSDEVLKKWESTVAWRLESRMDTDARDMETWRERDPNPLEVEEILHFGTLDERDLAGGVIYVERYGCIDPAKLLKLDPERARTFVRAKCEEFCKEAEATGFVRPTNIIDINGAGFKHLRILGNVREWTGEKQENYPANEGSKTFVLGESIALGTIWNLVKPWLKTTTDGSVSRNIEFLGPRDYCELLERIPAHAIPQWCLEQSAELAAVVKAEQRRAASEVDYEARTGDAGGDRRGFDRGGGAHGAIGQQGRRGGDTTEGGVELDTLPELFRRLSKLRRTEAALRAGGPAGGDAGADTAESLRGEWSDALTEIQHEKAAVKRRIKVMVRDA